jgi:hypothetical protein
MRALALLAAISLAVPVLAEGPPGQPQYARGDDNWFYGCWFYPKSRAIHGRLRNKDREVIGKRNGETIKTSIGTLVWRGNYSSDKAPEKSTGWLFTFPPIGPPMIFDSYDPKTNTLRH